MPTYSELLNTTEWKNKRSQILVRDKYLCQNCLNENVIKDCIEAHGTKIEGHSNKFNFRLTIQEFFFDAFISEECKSIIPEETVAYFDRIGDYIKVFAFKGIRTNDFIYVPSLHVHHKYYQVGLKPWEYPDNGLTTYCWICHEEVHSKNQVPKLDSRGNEIGKMTPCYRCYGAGVFPEFRHVHAGICFRCEGACYEELIGKTV